MEMTSKKIGILGGSFDPIHAGHIRIAQNAYQEFGLDEVWFIPAGHSPNKNEARMTPGEIRAKLVELAIAEYPHFRLSRIELDSEETSYTYRTLTKLKEQYPDTQFFFIMGADSLDYFDCWVHPEIICQKAVILTAVRDNMELAQIQAKIQKIKTLFPAEIYPLTGEKMDISSSDLRERIKTGDTDDPMLPAAVAEYIRTQGLYRG